MRLTVGLKVEADPYVKPEPLPDLRLAWSPSGALTLWGAVSMAVRSPTPFDREASVAAIAEEIESLKRQLQD